VDRVGIVRDANAVSGQLLPKSYRPGAADRRGRAELADPLRERLRPVNRRLPDAGAVDVVEGREHLAAPTVEDRQRLAGRILGAEDSPAEGVEGANPVGRKTEADGETAGGRDADPQAGEGAGAEPDRDQVDGAPATGRVRRFLDLGQQAGGVTGPTLRGEPQSRLVQDLAIAPGAGDGVDRRGVEADDDQRLATPSPRRRLSRPSCL
jgi:hypothetical protein